MVQIHHCSVSISWKCATPNCPCRYDKWPHTTCSNEMHNVVAQSVHSYLLITRPHQSVTHWFDCGKEVGIVYALCSDAVWKPHQKGFDNIFVLKFIENNFMQSRIISYFSKFDQDEKVWKHYLNLLHLYLFF